MPKNEAKEPAENEAEAEKLDDWVRRRFAMKEADKKDKKEAEEQAKKLEDGRALSGHGIQKEQQRPILAGEQLEEGSTSSGHGIQKEQQRPILAEKQLEEGSTPSGHPAPNLTKNSVLRSSCSRVVNVNVDVDVDVEFDLNFECIFV